MLYRGFNQEEYARQFMVGKFRLGNLNLYKSIEDKTRQDESEGDGYVSFPMENMITVYIDPSTGKTVRESTGPRTQPFS